MAAARKSRIGRQPSRFRAIAIPVGSILLGSLLSALPIIAQSPVMPPFGLLLLVGWRLLRPEFFPLWIPLPLGLVDDLMSGQPLGSAVCLWTVAFLFLESVGSRLVWRDYWQDWLLAALCIIFVLAGGLALARVAGGNATIPIIMPQTIWSIFLYPAVARLCAALDRWRLA